MSQRQTVGSSGAGSICGVSPRVRLFMRPRVIILADDSDLSVENDLHCDFKKLRGLLIRTYMLDLITTTEEVHYEQYRIAQMETRKFGEPKIRKVDNPQFKEEEEALRKRFTDQVKLEEARFRQWEQHVSPDVLLVDATSRIENVGRG